MKSKTASQELLPQDLPPFKVDHYFEHLRKKEFGRLDSIDEVYLDYTGSGLYPDSLVKNYSNLIRHGNLGNPHSTNPASERSSSYENQTRIRILEFFNASDDYEVVFTQNASMGIKLIGESYQFTDASQYLVLADNHNSVIGIREYLPNKNGYSVCEVQRRDLRIPVDHMLEHLKDKPEGANNLFAFPAQSNVSGVQHDLNWIKTAQDLGWDVLLDAAAYVPTSILDLSIYKPDFVVLSFYKMFGFPTGIGALLIKKTSFTKLIKRGFAGGTVEIASALTNNKILSSSMSRRFENGTIDFLSFPAVINGLEFLSQVGMKKISARVKSLRQYLYDKLDDLKHSNGIHVVNLYGPHDNQNVGGTISMNVIDDNGKAYPYDTIQEKANECKINIRSGCFCNPGIDEVMNEITTENLNWFFNLQDPSYQCTFEVKSSMFGINRGAVRVAVGIPTTINELDRFINFVSSFRNIPATQLN